MKNARVGSPGFPQSLPLWRELVGMRGGSPVIGPFAAQPESPIYEPQGDDRKDLAGRKWGYTEMGSSIRTWPCNSKIPDFSFELHHHRTTALPLFCIPDFALRIPLTFPSLRLTMGLLSSPFCSC